MNNLRRHIAWRTQIPGFILLAAAVAGSIWLSVEARDISLWAWITTLVVAIGIVLKHYYYTYRIKDGQIERQKGIVARDVHSVRVQDLRNINYSQGIFGRILNFGNVEFSTAGGDEIEVRFEDVAQPAELKNSIEEQLRQAG